MCILIHSFQSLSHVQLFATPWIAARQASLSITNSGSLLKLMSIGSTMPSNHLIIYCLLLLLPSICPSIRVFSNESVSCIRWLKYWNFSINPSNEYSVLSEIIIYFQILYCLGKESISENQLFLHSLPNLCWGLIVFLTSKFFFCRLCLMHRSGTKRIFFIIKYSNNWSQKYGYFS